MRKLSVMVLLAAMLFCTACSGQTPQQKELTRVVFHRGHGSTWGSQFRMDICPSEISYLQYFTREEEGTTQHELTAIPVEEAQWEQVKTAVLQLEPQLQVKKAPGLLKRLVQSLAPPTVDGGEWVRLTLTWLINGNVKEIEYIWPAGEAAEALELLLKELAQTMEQ